MARYDGLIIPRSYSDYISKSDAATLSQALLLPGVLSQLVQSNDSKAISSKGVYLALQSYEKTFTTIEQLGLVFPCTVNDIYNALPTYANVMMNINDKSNMVTDVPVNFGILEIHKSQTRCLALYLRTLSNEQARLYVNNNIHNAQSTWEELISYTELNKVIERNPVLFEKSNISSNTAKEIPLPAANNIFYSLKLAEIAGSNIANYTIHVSADEGAITSVRLYTENTSNLFQVDITEDNKLRIYVSTYTRELITKV